MRFTILHMQIMMHHHALAEPYSIRNLAHANSQATIAYHQDLIRWGMLVAAPEWHSHFHTTPKGEAYIDALKDVSERFVPEWSPT
jgi:hypothetical protein